VKESKRTPAIRFPVMEHLGPLARFLAVWNTDFPPASHQVKSLVSEMQTALTSILLGTCHRGCSEFFSRSLSLWYTPGRKTPIFSPFFIPCLPHPISPRLLDLCFTTIPSARKKKNQDGRRKVLTRGFDNSRLVRLGGVTVAPAVREPLHHDEKKPARPTPPHKQRLAMVEKRVFATAPTEQDRLLVALHRPPNPK
jgi:hypothetical protein